VAADDPPCDQWHCQYFRITAPTDGSLEVALTYSEGNLDVFVNDPGGSQLWDPKPVRGNVRVSLPAKAGVTYQIGVMEYERPGVEFELLATLRPVWFGWNSTRTQRTSRPTGSFGPMGAAIPVSAARPVTRVEFAVPPTDSPASLALSASWSRAVERRLVSRTNHKVVTSLGQHASDHLAQRGVS
jgi:hypothetical protein